MEEKRLFIVTGINGSGKTTLAKALSEKLGLEVMTINALREHYYDKYCFEALDERKTLDALAEAHFRADLTRFMRCDVQLVVDHPFSKRWDKFFRNLCSRYGYQMIVINCNTRDFEEIWEKSLEREKTGNRHPAHRCKSYQNKDRGDYILDTDIDFLKTDEKMKYGMGYYTQMTGDKTYSDEEAVKVFSLELRGI